MYCKITFEGDYIYAFNKFIEAVSAFHGGDINKAHQLSTESIRSYPRLGCAYNLLGAIHLYANKPDTAQQAFMIAQALLPDSTFESLNLATLFYNTGNIKRSTAYIDRGLEIAKLNEDTESYLDSVRRLQDSWEHGKLLLFIDSPDPTVFEDDEI
jgi:predicted Zn-dependent protease